MTRTFKQATNKFDRSKQQKYPNIPGFLGFMVNGVETVEVPSRPGYVFVRLRGTVNEVIHAFNDEVSPVYGLPVLVTRDDIDNTRYRVISRDTGVYVNWGTTSSYLPRHGDSHSFSDRQGTGGDVVWVYGRQMMPLLVMPSGSVAGGSVYINEGIYYQIGQWRQAGGTGTVSLLPASPSAGNARMMLIYLDEYGNPGIATGTVFSEIYSGTSSIIQYLPNISNSYYVPLAGVRLTSTTSTISWGDIYDLRPWIVGDGFIPTGTFAPNSAGYVTIGSEAGLTAERTLTAGAGISITDGGANSTVVISSTSSASPTYPSIYDDNTFKATGTAIHFNTNLTVINTGTSVWIDGQAGGSSTPTYPAIYDSGAFIATGTEIDFDGDLKATKTLIGNERVYISVSTGTFSRANHTHPGIEVYDDGTLRGNASSIDFGSDLAVIATGTSMFVYSTASGGGGGGGVVYDNNIFRVSGTLTSFNNALSVEVTGTAAYVSLNLDQVVFVAQSDTTYTNIQDAIDSITDASIGKKYVVKVMPGVYTPFTLKDYITVEGSGKAKLINRIGSSYDMYKGLSETWIEFSGTSTDIVMGNYTGIRNLSISGDDFYDVVIGNKYGCTFEDISITSNYGCFYASGTLWTDLSFINVDMYAYQPGSDAVTLLGNSSNEYVSFDNCNIYLPSDTNLAMYLKGVAEARLNNVYTSHPGSSTDDCIYLVSSDIYCRNSTFDGGRINVATSSSADFKNCFASSINVGVSSSVSGDLFLTSNNVFYDKRLDFDYAKLTEKAVSPSTPPSGYGYLYGKNDGKIYYENDAGTEYDLTLGGAGGGGGGDLRIYDDSVFKVTGTAISFDTNLSVAVTGTTAFVSSSSSNDPIFNGWNYQSTNRSTTAYAFKGNFYVPSREIKLYALGYWGTAVASASYKAMVIIGTTNINSIVGTSETVTMSGSLPDTNPHTTWFRFNPSLTLSSGTKYGFIYGRINNTGTYVLPVPFNESWTSPFDSDDGSGEGLRLESDNPASGTAISTFGSNASMGFQWSYV